MILKHGSLFSGIGGFDLAAEWMGWDNVFHCEIETLQQLILKHNFPKSKLYNDIRKTDFTIYRGIINILTGGFPCQPFSLAGQKLGIDDPRHLWPQMLRAIREIQPEWVVGENVFGIINWGGGMVFEQVQADLEAQGYEVQPYILPACGKDALHRCDRVFFVAHSVQGRQLALQCTTEEKSQREPRENFNRIPENGTEYNVLQKYSRDINGVPSELDAIGAYGNAVHTGVVLEIFKAIEKYEKLIAKI